LHVEESREIQNKSNREPVVSFMDRLSVTLRIAFQTHTIQREKPYWKMNTAFLQISVK